jgi:hypothetical protein
MNNPPFHATAFTNVASNPTERTTAAAGDPVAEANHEIAALAHRVATARGKLPLQTDPALFAELSEQEMAAELELAAWTRAQRRRQRRRAVSAELAAEKRDRRVARWLTRVDQADDRWHRRALAARRRVSNPDARLAQLYRRAEWSSRALIGVVVLGMVWAGVNVQHNLVPSGDMSNPLYWLSYGFEAMISIPIIAIMILATTAARWGREIQRGRIVFLEAALLAVTVALNAGPHLADHHPARAAATAVAPIMVGAVIWLHAWTSTRYASLIDSAGTVTTATEPSNSVDTAATDANQIRSGRDAVTYVEQHIPSGTTDTEHPATKVRQEPTADESVAPNAARPTRQVTITAESGVAYRAQYMTWAPAGPESAPGAEPDARSSATDTERTVTSATETDSTTVRPEMWTLAAEVHQITRARTPITMVASVLELHQSGEGSPSQIARRLRLNYTSVNGWIKAAAQITTRT